MTLFNGLQRMDVPVLTDQQGFTDINSVQTVDAVKRISQQRWTRRKDGEWNSGEPRTITTAWWRGLWLSYVAKLVDRNNGDEIK